ncbi:hypothetical protein D3C81_1861350 [compost metagenome]
MGDTATELTDGLQLLRLEQRFAGYLQFPLGLGRFADVAGDLGKPQDRPGFTADRVDDHVGEKARAVLAHAPALLFKPPFAGRHFQRPFGLARGAVFGGIEH